jgi:outer membrane protein TolC
MSPRFQLKSPVILSVFFGAAMAGCASYAPLPLETRSPLKHNLAELADRGGSPANGALGITAISRLAVENNPDLRAARNDRQIAEAQLLQAGLLPNPQLSGGFGLLLGGPGTSDSWTAAISEDIKALITLSANKRSARFEGQRVEADLVWQEWQVMGKARLLYVDIVEGDKLAQLLTAARDLLAERNRRNQRAVAQGNLDLTASAPDLRALTDLQKQIADLERQQQLRRADLDALLGLSPDVSLPLDANVDLPPLDLADVARLLPELADRRPDLIALQLGYRSQEQKVWAAILAQFPNLSFGGAWTSDTTGVRSAGPQLTLELPIFNRNQGNIAIERATRQKLHDEFAARLAAATGEAQTSAAAQALIERQLAARRVQFADADAIASHAEAAFRAGDLDERGYVDLALTRSLTEQDIVALEQILLEQQVALATLMGAGMPAVTLSPADKESGL